MFIRTMSAAALVLGLATGAAAQNATAVLTAASKAMGADALTSITYSGTARNGAFGQSKAIGDPMGPVNVTQITQYTRTLTFAAPSDQNALVSRATGPTQPPTIPGVPAQAPGVFNQNVTAAQLGNNWTQALNVWTTPWGFLKGAAANNATARAQTIGGRRYQEVSWNSPMKSPGGQPYKVVGFINNQNLVERVQTWLENPVFGDMLRIISGSPSFTSTPWIVRPSFVLISVPS